jgi:hypothetical protein
VQRLSLAAGQGRAGIKTAKLELRSQHVANQVKDCRGRDDLVKNVPFVYEIG